MNKQQQQKAQIQKQQKLEQKRRQQQQPQAKAGEKAAATAAAEGSDGDENVRLRLQNVQLSKQLHEESVRVQGFLDAAAQVSWIKYRISFHKQTTLTKRAFISKVYV